MRLAVLDIGTNTVLLLVASFDAQGHISTDFSEQRVIRVGEGIQHTARISEPAEQRLASTLEELHSICRERFGDIPMCAFGTSVFRRASNAPDVVQRIEAATGVRIEILSGDDEARWTFTGALRGDEGKGNICVIDIGGGSTEVVVGVGGAIETATSLDVGVVVLREHYFPSLPPTIGAIDAAREEIAGQLRDATRKVIALSPTLLVAVAGTPTTLAALTLQLDHYDPMRVDGMMLDVSTVDAQCAALLNMNHEELLALPGVDARRADVLPAGALILHTFMSMTKFGSVRVSDRGVRYGIALRNWLALRAYGE